MSMVDFEKADAPQAEELPLQRGPYVAPHVNLLPPEVAERHALRKLQAGLAAGVVACAAVVGVLYYASDKGRADAQSRLDSAAAEGQQLDGQKQQLLPVQAQRAKTQQARAALQAATSTEVLWSRQLDLVRQHLSEDVGLTSFTVTPVGASATGGGSTTAANTPTAPAASAAPSAGGTATTAPTATGGVDAAGSAPTSTSGPSGTIIATVAMAGVANTPTDVANWLDTLDALPGWSDVYSQNVTRSGDYFTFTLTADIDQTVLANRYPTGN